MKKIKIAEMVKKEKKINFIFTIAGLGTWLGIAILGAVILGAEHKKLEKDAEIFINNTTIKEAPLLDVNKVIHKELVELEGFETYFLKLDVNKNGIFDSKDIIVKSEKKLPLQRNKNIVYFENKSNNEKGVIAYQTEDNSYIEDYVFDNKILNKKFSEKFTEYMENNNQR